MNFIMVIWIRKVVPFEIIFKTALGPVNKYPFLFETEIFYVYKNRRPHLVFFNRFCPSTRKRNSDWKRCHLWWEHTRLLVYEPVTCNRLKKKTPQHWRMFLKRCVLVTVFYLIRIYGVKARPEREKTEQKWIG